jgi:hypothetical protein
MLPAACLSALLCPLLVWPFAAPLDVSTIDLRKLFLFGTTQFGLGLVFLIQNRGECILHFIRHSITGHQPQQQGLRHRERANQRVQNAACRRMGTVCFLQWGTIHRQLYRRYDRYGGSRRTRLAQQPGDDGHRCHMMNAPEVMSSGYDKERLSPESTGARL